jgi:hypothetical protein
MQRKKHVCDDDIDQVAHSHPDLKRKEDRIKAVITHKDQFNKDPSPFLEATDWMSSEVSELDTDDEIKKDARRLRISTEIGMLPDRMTKETVWEVVRPIWRASRVWFSHVHSAKLTRFSST